MDSPDGSDLETTDRKKSALSDRCQWPELGPEDQVSLYDCTVEVIETVVHLYKAEIKDAPPSQRVQRLTSDGFQVLCSHMVWDLLKARVELFLVQTPGTMTNAWAPRSVAPVVNLSAEGSKHLSDAAGDISKTLLEYLVTPDSALSSVLIEAVTSGEAKFHPDPDLYLTVQSNLRDLVAKLNRSEISSSSGLPERSNDQVVEFAVGKEGHGDGGKRPGNVTPFWSSSALETARGQNSLLEDPMDLDRTPVTDFVEDPGLGTSKDLPSYPCRADSALVLETSNEASHHRSTSPASGSARPVPAAAKRRKHPTFRFGKKPNKVHPFEMISQEDQATSSGNPQQASHGESEASSSSLKKLRKRLSRIFRVLVKA